jgi:hypothetical protein
LIPPNGGKLIPIGGFVADANEFDWGELGQDWWLKTAAQIGAASRHAKFAARKHAGATNTDAARQSGFGGGSEGSVRSEGYRLARSNKIMQLLALATAEAGGGYDGCVTAAESKQILSHLARGSDPQVRIKSIEALNKMQERELAAAASQPEMTPEEDTKVLLACPLGGLLAVAAVYLGIAQQYGPRVNLGAFPLLKTLAPNVKAEYPEIWNRILSKFDSDTRCEADVFAAAPPSDLQALTGKREPENAT